MNDTATEVVVTPETLPPMAWQQAKVITTDLLARLYGTQSKRIQDNYQNNASRFVEGKHYFRLEGEALREFKNYPEIIGVVQKNTRHMILWTERGAARHAKMLDTSEAWEVFEKLEDCYFAIQQLAAGFRPEKTRKALPGALTIEQQDAIKQLVKAKAEKYPQERRGVATIKLWSALKSKFGVGYKEIPAEHFTDALSLVARLEPLEGELLQKDEPEQSSCQDDMDAEVERRVQSAFRLGRWLMHFDDKGNAVMNPVPFGAFVVTEDKFETVLGEPGCVGLRYLPGIINACVKRLRQFVDRT